MRRSHAYAQNTTTNTSHTARPTFMSYFRRPAAAHTTGGMHVGTHGGTTAPVHYHKRHVTLGDKISDAMLRLKGSLTHRPSEKAAGTRRMHGTDGGGRRRFY